MIATAKRGRFRLIPVVVGVTVTYRAVADPNGSINSTTAHKINFWDHMGDLFPFSQPPDVGVA